MSKRGLDAPMKKQLLDLHNKLRQKIANGKQIGQPAASNMKELHWDDELAANAQHAAEKCKFKHSPDKETATSKYEGAGENIYRGTYPNPIQTAVDGWFSEVKDVSPAVLKKFQEIGPPNYIGHYTQLVWAETEAVGCGYIKSADDGKDYIFCQYGPQGNYEDEPVYKQGRAASACENGVSAKYSGLCG